MIYRWREAAFNLTVLQRYCLRSRRKNILRMNEKKKNVITDNAYGDARRY